MSVVTVNHYTGWLPRYMRRGYSEARRNGSGGATKGSKATRLSKTKTDRHIYCSPHGYRSHPDIYRRMCERSDKLNGIRRQNVQVDQE